MQTCHFRCNIIYLWLPSLVNLLMTYSMNYPDYGVTLCQVAQFREEIIVVNASDYSTVNNTWKEPECVVNVPTGTYEVSLVIGFLSFFVFILSGLMTRYVGNRKLLGEWDEPISTAKFLLN